MPAAAKASLIGASASDQDRLAQARVVEGVGGARDLRLLAFGEDDALGRIAHLGEDAVQPAGHGIEPARQPGHVALHVDDRPARNARSPSPPWRRRAALGDQARIERRRDDVVGAVLHLPAEEGGGDLVGHILARQLCQRLGGGDLHGLVDGRGLHVERAAEDEGKAQHVVDLVGVVGAAGGDDGVRAHLGDLLRRDLGIGIGHGEDDRLVRHRLHHLLGHGAGGGQAEEGVGSLQRIGQRARLGLDGEARLPLVHAFLAAAVDHALGVAQQHVLLGHAHGGEQVHAGDAGGAGAVDDQLEVLDVAPRQLQRIDEAGGGDDGGAVLVVVEDGDVEQLLELLLDDEAVRRLDVLQVDAAEAGAQVAHAVDDGVDVGRVDQDVDGVDVGEALEQRALALHHRLGRHARRDCRAPGSPCRWRRRPPGCPCWCSRRRGWGPGRWPAPARPHPASRRATDRAGWSAAWSA